MMAGIDEKEVSVDAENALVSAYRALPRTLREPIWNLRRYFRSVDRSTARSSLADFYVSIGRKRATVKLPNGTSMCLDLRDTGVGRPLFCQLPYEPAETLFVSRYLREGMAFGDIGANIGYYTILASTRVGARGKVFAFEPDPWNFRLLSENVCRNGMVDRVAAHQCALGDTEGKLPLWRSAENYGDHRIGPNSVGRSGVEVQIRVYDNLSASDGIPQLDMLKIDVQGYEAHVFQGMGKTLRNAPPNVILMEFWPDGILAAGSDPSEYLASFNSFGFNYGILERDGTVVTVALKEILNMVPPPIPLQPDSAYVNVVLYQDKAKAFLYPGLPGSEGLSSTATAS